MALFKFIGFDKPYWSQPLIEKTLYFSSIPELRSGNDKHEFDYNWKSNGWFIKNYVVPHLSPAFKRLYDNARILCMSKTLSKRCWEEYCREGGVCYEFEPDPCDDNDVSHDHVRYRDDKVHCVPEYLIQRCTDMYVDLYLRFPNKPEQDELRRVQYWLDRTDEPNRIILDHIKWELVWKKRTDFEFENEYRLIHLAAEVGIPLKVQLVNSKAKYSRFGLKLVRIHSSEPKRVIELNDQIPICEPVFQG